jgi:hypothetical protein
MNVDESEGTPLYLAQVTQILREMSTAGGPFDYQAFKRHLKGKNFNAAQTSMLQMRLDLLESFLDMDGGAVKPHFQPGEITIMDMSCPFVDANMACILFRIGLKLYLQSETSGKMIVLDEAHKVCSVIISHEVVFAYPHVVHAQGTGRKGPDRPSLRHGPNAAALRCTRHHLNPGTYTHDRPYRPLLGHSDPSFL